MTRNAIERVVSRDSRSAKQEDAADLYFRYARILSSVIGMTKDDAWVDGVESALKKLAARDPQFGTAVNNYSQASKEILRWRGLVAKAEAKRMSERFQRVTNVFFEGNASTSEYKGICPAIGNPAFKPRLQDSVPRTMPTAVGNLMNREVTIQACLPSSRPGRSIGRLQSRVYGNHWYSLDLTPQIEALQVDLRASDDFPPLALDATVAINSAKSGRMIALGGQISGVYLDSVITHLGSSSARPRRLFELGEIPEPKVLLGDMLMRFDLVPMWGQHSAFFVPFAQF